MSRETKEDGLREGVWVESGCLQEKLTLKSSLIGILAGREMY
jgi:hypothetical protein